MRTSFLVGVGADRLVLAEGGGKHRVGRHAFLDQGAGHGQGALRRQFPVVGEAAVALVHRTVVGEAADHQHLFPCLQVARQRRGQRAQDLAALRLQLVGIEREQRVAADADAAVDQGDAAVGQWRGQRLFQRLALLRLGLALAHRLVQPRRQLQLHPDHADQDQHEHAQQHRHQVGERCPDRRRQAVLFAGVLDHAALRADRRCKSTRICFWLSTPMSITSRAWAT